jgi:hypothetical protein
VPVSRFIPRNIQWRLYAKLLRRLAFYLKEHLHPDILVSMLSQSRQNMTDLEAKYLINGARSSSGNLLRPVRLVPRASRRILRIKLTNAFGPDRLRDLPAVDEP